MGESWYSTGFSYGFTTTVENGYEEEGRYFFEDTDPLTGDYAIHDAGGWDDTRAETVPYHFSVYGVT